jgi:hypothetical protein
MRLRGESGEFGTPVTMLERQKGRFGAIWNCDDPNYFDKTAGEKATSFRLARDERP